MFNRKLKLNTAKKKPKRVNKYYTFHLPGLDFLLITLIILFIFGERGEFEFVGDTLFDKADFG